MKNIITTISIMVVVFLSIHFIQNNSAESIYRKYDTQNVPYGPYNEAITASGDRVVVNMSRGEAITETYYIKDKKGIHVLTPTDIYSIKGTIFWRFFDAGIFKTDQETTFTLNYLDNRSSRVFMGIRLDPTNPTPFSIIVIILLIYFSIVIFKKNRKSLSTATSNKAQLGAVLDSDTLITSSNWELTCSKCNTRYSIGENAGIVDDAQLFQDLSSLGMTFSGAASSSGFSNYEPDLVKQCTVNNEDREKFISVLKNVIRDIKNGKQRKWKCDKCKHVNNYEF